MKIILSILFSTLFISFFISCNKESDSSNKKAFIRIIHGVPDAGTLTVKLNENTITTIAAYGSSSAYIEVSALTANVTISSGNTNLVNTITSFLPNEYITVIVADSSHKIITSFFIDNVQPTAGKAMLNVLHLSTNTPSVNFVRVDTATKVLSTSRSFNDQMFSTNAASFINTDTISCTLQARAVVNNQTVIVAQTNSLKFMEGKVYTVVLRNAPLNGNLPIFTITAN
jgi:Domain of unknown function (DUF4397)